jgi:hypothetical protein
MDQAGHPAAASRSGQDAAAGEADAHASASSFLPGTRNHARAFVASSAANVSPQNLLSNGKAQLLTASGATVPLPAALLDSACCVPVPEESRLAACPCLAALLTAWPCTRFLPAAAGGPRLRTCG